MGTQGLRQTTIVMVMALALASRRYGQTVEGVFLRLLVHNHEHMGQAIAYARANGIVPPWSKAGGP